MNDDPESTTSILRRRAPVWAWLRENFKLPAVLTISSLVIAGGGYIVSLKTRVVVLETKVVPFVAGQVEVAAIRATMEQHEHRISELETDFGHARQIAGDPPKAQRRVK